MLSKAFPQAEKLPIAKDILSLLPKLGSVSQKKAAWAAATVVEEGVRAGHVESCLFNSVALATIYERTNVPHRLRAGYLRLSKELPIVTPHALVEVDGLTVDVSTNNDLPLLQFLATRKLNISDSEKWRGVALANGFLEDNMNHFIDTESHPGYRHPSLVVLGQEIKTTKNSIVYDFLTEKEAKCNPDFHVRQGQLSFEIMRDAISNPSAYVEAMPDFVKPLFDRIVNLSVEEINRMTD